MASSERKAELALGNTKQWPPLCWIVSDGTPGTENQSLGLAEAMGIAPVVKRLRLPRFRREANLHLGIGVRSALGAHGIAPPWPEMLIAAGRTSLVASRFVKKNNGPRTFVVQVQKPVVSPQLFDCVVVPEHDRLHGANVIPMIGSMHRVSPALLQADTAKWSPRFAHLPRPLVAVLLGGGNHAVSPLRRLSSYRLGPNEITDIASKLVAIARDRNAGFLVTASRRTGAENTALLRELLRDAPAMIWDGEGENPYYGMLGAADAIIVTCDSVNMISEACSTGKPVHMIRLPGNSKKRDVLHRKLFDLGCMRPFNGNLENWSYEPLHERERVAVLVRKAYEKARGAVTPR